MKQEELTPFEQTPSPETPEAIESLPETPEAQQEELAPDKAVEIVSNETEQAVTEEDTRLETGMKNLGFSGEETETLKQETGIGEELKANTEEIRTLADETTRQFTKEYSPKWRTAEAKRIRDMRKEYFDKKQAVAKENEARGAQRPLLENDLSQIETQMAQQKDELEKIDGEIEKRKSTAWFKIKSKFGFAEELPEEQKLKEKNSDLEELAREAEEKKQLLAETEEVVLDNAKLKLAKEEVRKFYEEQKGIKDVFEQEKDKERSVTEIAKQKQVLFLHGLPGSAEEDKLFYNPKVKTFAMGALDRAKVVIGLEPTISVSAKQFSKEGLENEKAITKELNGRPVVYRTGLLLNGGNIISAYGSDAGTRAEGKSRFSDNDEALRSSVQRDFSKNLDDALSYNIKEKKQFLPTNYTELVVEKPAVSGSFSYFDAPLGIYYGEHSEDYTGDRQRAKEFQTRTTMSALELSKGLGIPAYGVGENGELFELLNEDFNDISQEDVMSKKFSFSTDERVDYVKNSMSFSQNETLTNEAQQKLEEIQQMESGEKVEDPIRKEYQSKAEHMIQALDETYDGVYNMIHTESFFGAISESATMPEFLHYIQNEKNYSPQIMKKLEDVCSRYASVEEALRGDENSKVIRKKFADKMATLEKKDMTLSK